MTEQENHTNGSLGRVFDIQGFTVNDGPGIRTTVFLKGCPLRCVWCHNPESIAPEPQLSFLEERCTGCRACAAACPHGVHRWDDDTHLLDRALCTACGACVSACPQEALRVLGEEME